MKLEFKSLEPKQLEKIFISYLETLNLTATKQELHQVKSLKNLTPGDFATIKRHSKFKKIKSVSEFIERIKRS